MAADVQGLLETWAAGALGPASAEDWRCSPLQGLVIPIALRHIDSHGSAASKLRLWQYGLALLWSWTLLGRLREHFIKLKNTRTRSENPYSRNEP